MKSVIIHQARDLRVESTEFTDAPGAGQVEIAVEAGGICGSDLHYYQHGGFGAIRVKEPMALGHEVAGTIVSLGAGVTGLAPGDRVAINPSRPCGICKYCQAGQQHHCLDMLFYGSAMRTPHVQGAFRQKLIADASQCFPVADSVSLGEAAFAEPFAVTLHAVARAGSLQGKRVLITGCGPIGALTILAARVHGAREIVVTDIVDATLEKGMQVGADRAINVADDPTALDLFSADKGTFDVMFEASGNERALRAGMEVLKPRGILVQLGLGGDVSISQNLVVAKEIDLRGSFRFNEEFELAVDLINRRKVDVLPLLTATYPVDDAVTAFDAAGDRMTAMKVQLSFQ